MSKENVKRKVPLRYARFHEIKKKNKLKKAKTIINGCTHFSWNTTGKMKI